jgi:hypothetical protein
MYEGVLHLAAVLTDAKFTGRHQYNNHAGEGSHRRGRSNGSMQERGPDGRELWQRPPFDHVEDSETALAPLVLVPNFSIQTAEAKACDNNVGN